MIFDLGITSLKFVYVVIRYHPFINKVTFITYYKEGERTWVFRHGLFKKLTLPRIQVLKRSFISQIEDDYAGFGTAIKCTTQRLKSLLPSGIPNLQANAFTIAIIRIRHIYFFRMEIGSNCRFIRLRNAFSNKILN